MDTRIYRMYMAKATEAWYQLSKKAQDDMLARLQQALAKVGGKSVIMCRSAWASEQWQFFGVDEFPNLEAVQKISAIHEEMGWLRYVDSVTYVGTMMEQG